MSDRPTPTVDLEPPTRVLAIGAHPDDIEFGCGATLAKWSAAGAHVDMLVLTDGAKGTWDPHADASELAETRRREQDDAAHALGATAVHHTGYVDGELVDGPAEREAVCAAIRRARPDVLLTHDPWKRYRLHPDHRNGGFLVLDAVVAARDPHFFPGQGLEPHRPDVVLLFEAEVIDHYERVDATLVAKIGALLAHRSQWRSTMGIDPTGSDADAQRAAFAERIRREAEISGTTVGGLAEGFKRLDEI